MEENKKKKIGIIGIRGLPARYGAFDTFVDQLVNSSFIKKKNFFFYISSEKKFKNLEYKNSFVKQIFLYRGKNFSILINYFLSIFFMYFSGVRTFIFFGYGAAPFFIILNILRCKIICNPDGIEWRRPEGRLKIFFFKICEKIISKLSITRVYDSKVIARYYKINHRADGNVIYYPSIFEKFNLQEKKKKFRKNRFYIIGRLLEENNTFTIVKAFSEFKSSDKLYIIGNSNDYFKDKILPIVKNSKNIIFLGPIYNKEKLFKICNCIDFYIHGHSVGGTNPTLIEAISLKKKIIAYKTFFNKEILKDKCLYFSNTEQLKDILKNKSYESINLCDFKKEFTAEYINNTYLNLM